MISIYLSVCLSVCLSFYLSVCLSIYLSLYLFIRLAIYISSLAIYQSFYMSVYLFYLSIYLFYLSILSIYSIYLFYLSICLSIYLSTGLSICLRLLILCYGWTILLWFIWNVIQQLLIGNPFAENASESERKDLLSELELMKQLKPHPYVIKLLGCVTKSGKYWNVYYQLWLPSDRIKF